MSSDDITDLQIRLTHQDDALQALTKTVLEQQRELEQLRAQLAQLARLVRELTPAEVDPAGSEPPPPHY